MAALDFAPLVQVVGEAIGTHKVRQTVAEAVARDLEQKLTELIQSSCKFKAHAHREALSTEDIQHGARLHNLDPFYGYASGDPMSFKRADGTEDLYYLEDAVIKFDAVLNEPLPRCPVEPTFSVHWLAIEGVQPAIPQNPAANAIAAAEDAAYGESVTKKRKTAQKLGAPAQVKPLVKHVLSKEQQLYYEQVVGAIKGTDELLKQAALKSLASDEGLHQLVPYFTQFIADEITRSLSDLPQLRSLMNMAQCLLTSPHLHVEPYLHQLMPPILTCLVGKSLCKLPTDDHWSLRDFCASMIALVCKQYGQNYTSLQGKITRTLAKAWLDQTKPLTTHYGAVLGLSSLGPSITKALILPNLRVYMQLLDEEMKQTKNAAKRLEAWKVYGALVHASGEFIRSELQVLEIDLREPPDDESTLQPYGSGGSSGTKSTGTSGLSNGLKSEGKASSSASSSSSEDTHMRDASDQKSSSSSSSSAANGSIVTRLSGSKRKRAVLSRLQHAGAVYEETSKWIAELFDIFGERLDPYTQATHCGPGFEPIFNIHNIFL